MTAVHRTSPIAPSALLARDAAPDTSASRRILMVGILLGCTAFAVAIAGLAIDARVIDGAPAWLKPAKFGASITLYLVTLRWMFTFVHGRRRLVTVICAVVVVVFAGELALIDLQVIRGTTSHFNESTTFDAAVYYSMGGLISAVFGATVLTAVLVLRTRGVEGAALTGIRLGLLLALLGMLEAVLMTVNFGWNDGGGHTVGAPDGGPGLPVTDWSLAHGDLRIGHFLGLHALQALPILAWLLSRVSRLDERRRVLLLRVAGAGYAGLIALVTWQALRGQPVAQPDILTVAAAVGILLPVAVGTGVVLRRRTGAIAR